ncbi:hypothetical protein [Fodinicola acaciae]|uniref:hypothetical protein n=1 Tax=Fodinicola acaciae TaxID=2681555 RepID=UPI0013D0BA23|nr:hypothetical protein [Fodinicola acaciae]
MLDESDSLSLLLAPHKGGRQVDWPTELRNLAAAQLEAATDEQFQYLLMELGSEIILETDFDNKPRHDLILTILTKASPSELADAWEMALSWCELVSNYNLEDIVDDDDIWDEDAIPSAVEWLKVNAADEQLAAMYARNGLSMPQAKDHGSARNHGRQVAELVDQITPRQLLASWRVAVGVNLESRRVIPTSGLVKFGTHWNFYLNPKLAGQSLVIRADVDRIGLFLDDRCVFLAPSELSEADLSFVSDATRTPEPFDWASFDVVVPPAIETTRTLPPSGAVVLRDRVRVFLGPEHGGQVAKLRVDANETDVYLDGMFLHTMRVGLPDPDRQALVLAGKARPIDRVRPTHARDRSVAAESPADSFDIDRARRLYEDDKLTLEQTAEAMAVKLWKVRARLMEAGVVMRPRHAIRNSKFTPELLAKARKMYEDDQLTTTVIAQRLGFSASTVGHSLHVAGVRLRPGGHTTIQFTPDQLRLARDIYLNQGKGYRAVAKALGTNYNAVRRALIEAGVKPRPRVGTSAR